MASGEGSPRASKEVTINALLAAIMSVKHDLSGRMEWIEEMMDGMEGSFSRRMDTLEVCLDSNHSSLKHYHASTSGHATTPDTFPQLLNPPRPTHEPIHQVPTYPKNRSEDLYRGEESDEAILFVEFMHNRRRAYGGGHRGQGGRVRMAHRGRGNLGHRPHVQEVEPLNHCLARFKGGLCYEVVSQLVVHKFDQIKDLIEAAIEVERNNHTKKTFGWDKSYKPLEKKPFDKTIQSEFPNRRNIILVEGDPYFVGDKVTKNDVSEGTPQEDDRNDGEPERVVEEGKVNVPCGLMRRTSHDDAWPEEGERPPPACCDEIRKQDPKCLCEYLKNPAYQQYVNRANVEKALRDCALVTPAAPAKVEARTIFKVSVLKYAKYIKVIMPNKNRLMEYVIVALTEVCITQIQKRFPTKLKDPGRFTIQITIGQSISARGVCDLGESINIMPISLFRKMRLGSPRPTAVVLHFADHSLSRPDGIVENILVHAGSLIFPMDFIILDFDANV
ncbi:hypothetical protein FXO38_06755 [Capsicum annuum]|uniref:Bifunctional inhibitor/plant lipid transfer protein/seed storage helical domain-containing protein n=1 Tax=Capsicum annuum TaxID=4072 RepID=A0A2G2ZMQ0_CAPAN|nr:hypothetical protein FXO38_06755 [Capsicum annuum]PHT83270.1 hypothetical protein T459_11713 [Capsicum annuum]